ncbi:MAG: DNA gyrase inhibitor YacG [Acidobacteria bacterium]|nr:DNA gyrase inhibitor YacG [Acidobacteriota bacterium]
MKCPICKKEVAFTDPEMPFCSPRCRLLDLGNWASEKYVISSPIPPEDLENFPVDGKPN